MEHPHQVFWIYGLPGSGKTTVGMELARFIKGVHLDADEARSGLCSEFTFSEPDRKASCMRIAQAAALVCRWHPVVVSAVTPLETIRQAVREIVPHVRFAHLDASQELLDSRGAVLWPATTFIPPRPGGLSIDASLPVSRIVMMMAGVLPADN